MSIITRAMKQTAVYWAPADVPFDDFGKPAVATPIELACRWEDLQEEFVRPDGTQAVSEAKVMVDQDLSLGGFLLLTTLEDLDETEWTDPVSAGALEIMSFQKTPNLRATESLRVVVLGKGGRPD